MKPDHLSYMQSFLSTHTTMVLATLGQDGRPQTAPLFYAENENLDLIFISEAKTDHAHNIARDPRVAGSIAADGQNWVNIRGLQFEGTCTRLSGPDAREASRVYASKYPFIQENKILKLALSKAYYFKIKPTWIRLVDNTQGFGHKQEIQINNFE